MVEVAPLRERRYYACFVGIVPNGMLLRYIVAEKYSRQDAANRMPEACAPPAWTFVHSKPRAKFRWR